MHRYINKASYKKKTRNNFIEAKSNIWNFALQEKRKLEYQKKQFHTILLYVHS